MCERVRGEVCRLRHAHIHMLHALTLLHRAVERSAWCDEPQLHSVLLSGAPQNTREPAQLLKYGNFFRSHNQHTTHNFYFMKNCDLTKCCSPRWLHSRLAIDVSRELRVRFLPSKKTRKKKKLTFIILVCSCSGAPARIRQCGVAQLLASFQCQIAGSLLFL